MSNPLFQGIQLGPIHLENRIVMAPMTRSRANNKGVQSEMAAQYYAQRASAGLIISEAINISDDAIGSPLTPGLYHPEDVLGTFRPYIKGLVIANGGYDEQKALAELNSGRADLVSFGALFIANPDLPARFKVGAPLAEPDKATMYGGDAHGYIDYPPMSS